MDFNSMRMTHEQLSDDKYRLRVGDDIIEVKTNFRYLQYFDDFCSDTITHYIKTPNNKPTNSNRTLVLLDRVYDYFRRLFLEEIEEDLREISSFPISSTGTLQRDYKGRRFNFSEWDTPHDIFNKIHSTCCSTSASGDETFYSTIVDLAQKNDGFLSVEIKQYLYGWLAGKHKDHQ